MNKLEIDDHGVEEERLEFPISNWLAEQGRCNILAGAIYWPSCHWQTEQGGWHSHHEAVSLHWQAPVVQGNDRDIEWLINEVGVKPDEMEWMSLWDDFDLTRSDMALLRNEIRGRRRKPMIDSRYMLTSDHIKRCRASGKSIREFLEDEAKAGRWPAPEGQ